MKIKTALILCSLLLALNGCVPQKEAMKLKSQLHKTASTVDSLTLRIADYSLREFDYRRQVKYLTASKDSLSYNNNLLQSENSKLNEKNTTNTSLIEYYENGNVKSQFNQTNTKELQSEITNYKLRITKLEKQLTTANSRIEQADSTASMLHQSNLEINHYADSVSVVNQQLTEQINKQSGLNWWQKTQIYGFWVLSIFFIGRWIVKKYLGGWILSWKGK